MEVSIPTGILLNGDRIMAVNCDGGKEAQQETRDFLANCLEHRAEVEDFLSSMERMKKEYKGGTGGTGSSTIVIKVDSSVPTPAIKFIWEQLVNTK